MAAEPDVVEPGVGARVDEFFSRFEALGFEGTVLVATGDGILLRKGYGYADRAGGVRNTSSTAFGIASLDKQFTAVAILLLEREGRLKTSDPISTYLDDVPEDKAEITIGLLLDHRSGLRNMYRDQHAQLTHKEFIAKILNTKLAAPTGTRRIYSNSGFNLLEDVIERVSGMGYEAFVAKHLFEPAGMKSTGQHLVEREDHETAKYKHNKQRQELLAREPKRLDPFLSFRTTVGDFYRWHLALQGDRVLTAADKEKLYRPVVGDYANGWYIGRTRRDTPVYYHGGYDTAVDLFAMFYRFPAEDTVIIAFANTTMNGTLKRLYLSVAVERMIFGGAVEMPPRAVSIAAEKLSGFEGTYQLETGGRLRIKQADGGLSVRTFDRDAILAMVYPDSAAEEPAFALDDRIADVFFGFDKGDFEPLRSVLWESVSFDRAKSSWGNRWKLSRKSKGDLQSIRTIHRFETEYKGAPEVQTHLLLEFERGNGLVRAIADRTGRFVFDLIDLPRALEMRLVPVSETEFAGWNLKRQMGPKIVFHDDSTRSLTIEGKAGRLAATRESSD